MLIIKKEVSILQSWTVM